MGQPLFWNLQGDEWVECGAGVWGVGADGAGG